MLLGQLDRQLLDRIVATAIADVIRLRCTVLPPQTLDRPSALLTSEAGGRTIAALGGGACQRRLRPMSRLANMVKIAHSLLPLQAMLQKCSARQEKIIPAIRPALSLSIPMFLRLSR